MQAMKQAAAEFLAGKRVAVTGVSRKPQGHGSNAVYQRLRQRGYQVLARTSAPLLRPWPCWTRPSCDLGFRGAWNPMAGALLGPVQRRWARLDGCHPGGTSRSK